MKSVEPETQYLQVLYDAKFPALPIDLRGKTFSRVFGTRSSVIFALLSARCFLFAQCWKTFGGVWGGVLYLIASALSHTPLTSPHIPPVFCSCVALHQAPPSALTPAIAATRFVWRLGVAYGAECEAAEA